MSKREALLKIIIELMKIYKDPTKTIMDVVGLIDANLEKYPSGSGWWEYADRGVRTIDIKLTYLIEGVNTTEDTTGQI